MVRMVKTFAAVSAVAVVLSGCEYAVKRGVETAMDQTNVNLTNPLAPGTAVAKVMATVLIKKTGDLALNGEDITFANLEEGLRNFASANKILLGELGVMMRLYETTEAGLAIKVRRELESYGLAMIDIELVPSSG